MRKEWMRKYRHPIYGDKKDRPDMVRQEEA